MKEIKLLSLQLNNFKKIKKETYAFDGQNHQFIGKNGVGKSTVFDAYLWLLSGKDSQDKTELNFGIKTKIDNEVQHNLIHSVLGVFSIDGTELTLLREFSEKWTRKKGSTSKEFTGHTTKYFIDDVPILKKKDYEAKIKEVFSDYFSLLSNPHYFNDDKMFSADKRREFLIEMFGDITDDDVINSNPKTFEAIKDLLTNKSVNDIMASSKSQLKAINNQIQDIPGKVNELNNQVDEHVAYDIEAGNNGIKMLEAKKDSHNENIAKIKADNGNSEIKVKLSETKSKLIEINAKIEKESGSFEKKNEDIKRLHNKSIQSHKNAASQLQMQIDENNRTIEITKKDIEFYTAQMDEIRDNYNDIKERNYDSSQIETVCPTCGQSLDEDKIKETIQSETRKFNQTKAKRLEEINSKGLAWKNKVEEKQQYIDNLLKTNLKLTEDKAVEILKYEKLESEKPALIEVTYNPDDIAKRNQLEKDIKELEALREQELSVDISGLFKADELAIDEINGEISIIQEKIASEKSAQSIRQRIDELQQEEKDLAKEYERLERIVEACETFIQTKANMLSNLINSEFELTEFRLFEEQINGGIHPTCIATGKDGVAWNEAMNTGQKANIGLDIIKTFSRKLGITLPIFVENAESITEVQKMNNQIIKLIHNPDFDVLVFD